jgi:hypothetical protein
MSHLWILKIHNEDSEAKEIIGNSRLRKEIALQNIEKIEIVCMFFAV